MVDYKQALKKCPKKGLVLIKQEQYRRKGSHLHTIKILCHTDFCDTCFTETLAITCTNWWICLGTARSVIVLRPDENACSAFRWNVKWKRKRSYQMSKSWWQKNNAKSLRAGYNSSKQVDNAVCTWERPAKENDAVSSSLDLHPLETKYLHFPVGRPLSYCM